MYQQWPPLCFWISIYIQACYERCASRFECPIRAALTSILVTSSATIAVLIVFAVQGLKLTHALIRSALFVLDQSITLIRYFFFINYVKPFHFEANSGLNRFNLHGEKESSNTWSLRFRRGLWCKVNFQVNFSLKFDITLKVERRWLPTTAIHQFLTN
jgi:hypothetical protein